MKPKRDPAKEDELRGFVLGAKLDSSSLRLERVGRGDRWRVIVEGEIVAELSAKEHRRLISHLLFIGEEHSAGIELAARKIAHEEGVRGGSHKGGATTATRPESKAPHIRQKVRAVLARGEDPRGYRDVWMEQYGCSRHTVYRAIRDVMKTMK